MLASGGMRSGAGKVSEREKVHYRRWAGITSSGSPNRPRERGVAEREGFEPPGLAAYGFQDRCLQPLGHRSASIVACGVSAQQPRLAPLLLH